MSGRYDKLTAEQLKGADYALRLLHTSPVFRGRALEIIVDQHAAVQERIKALSKAAK